MTTLNEPDEIQERYDLMREDLEVEGSEVPSIEEFKEMIKDEDDE